MSNQGEAPGHSLSQLERSLKAAAERATNETLRVIRERDQAEEHLEKLRTELAHSRRHVELLQQHQPEKLKTLSSEIERNVSRVEEISRLAGNIHDSLDRQLALVGDIVGNQMPPLSTPPNEHRRLSASMNDGGVDETHTGERRHQLIQPLNDLSHSVADYANHCFAAHDAEAVETINSFRTELDRFRNWLIDEGKENVQPNYENQQQEPKSASPASLSTTASLNDVQPEPTNRRRMNNNTPIGNQDLPTYFCTATFAPIQ